MPATAWYAWPCSLGWGFGKSLARVLYRESGVCGACSLCGVPRAFYNNTVIHPATADFIECNGMYNGEAGRYLVGLLSFSNVSGRRRAAHVRRWPPRYTTFSAFSKLATRCVGRAEHVGGTRRAEHVERNTRGTTSHHLARASPCRRKVNQVYGVNQ